MNTKPLISIIIPVHNTALYIDKCINSVLDQSLRNIEVILVDNLSTDNSLEICRKYELQDKRVKVISLSKAGLSIARNAGVDIATAPYIGFIDSDDYIEPDMYQSMYDTISSGNADIVFCNFCYEYDNGTTEQIYQNTGNTSIYTGEEVQRLILTDKVSSSACTKLYKKEFFQKNRFPEGVYFEDHTTLYRWIKDCSTCIHIDKAFYHYYQRTDSICHTINAEKHLHYLRAEIGRLKYIEENSVFAGEELTDFRNKIVDICIRHITDSLSRKNNIRMNNPYVKAMRKEFRYCTRYTSDELIRRNYKRVRKICYFWPIYYYTHRF